MRIPRAPGRAHLPLLPSGPGGVGRDTATRGTTEECTGYPGQASNSGYRLWIQSRVPSQKVATLAEALLVQPRDRLELVVSIRLGLPGRLEAHRHPELGRVRVRIHHRQPELLDL